MQTGYSPDFGFLPGFPQRAPARVRSEMSGGNVFGQYLMSFIMLGGCGGAFGLGGVVCLVVGLRGWGTRDAIFAMGSPLFLAAAVAFAVITWKVMARSNRWVELDGDRVRARNLYTGRVLERSVWEIQEITTEVFVVATAGVYVTEALHGRVRGFAILFPDVPGGIRVYQPEMRGVGELMEGLVAKLSERGRVVSEIIEFDGRPMIRRLVWESSTP